MIEIKATPKFTRLAKKAMTTEALQELIDTLAVDPEQEDIIRNTGGIRKLRWATGKGRSKCGGLRVLYYMTANILFYWSLYLKNLTRKI